MTIDEKVWGLWPDLDAMANAIGASPVELRRQRDAGELPGKHYDRILIARAIFRSVNLSHADLEAARASRTHAAAAGKIERKQRIASLIDHLGGTEVAAGKIGVTKNVIGLARSRGRLPRAHRHELIVAAKQVGAEIADDLFGP